MSTFVIHALIPAFVVLAVGVFRVRDVWVWSWAAWINDVDYLGWVTHVQYGWPNVHRAAFHNVWILFVLLWLAYWVGWRTFARTGGTTLRDFATGRPGWLLVPFFYASHLVLDLFQGGFVAFWPLSNRDVFWGFELDVDTSRPVPTPQVDSQIGSEVGVPDVSQVYPWLTGEQLAFVILYALSLLGWFLYERANRRQGLDEAEVGAARL